MNDFLDLLLPALFYMTLGGVTAWSIWFLAFRKGGIDPTGDYDDEAGERLQKLVDHAHGISRPVWPERRDK